MAAARLADSAADRYLDYFRDLGIHDFYRCGTLRTAELLEPAPTAQPEPAAAEPVPPTTRPRAVLSQAVPPQAVPPQAVASQVAPPQAVVPGAGEEPPAPPPGETPIPKPISFNDLAPVPELRVAPQNRAAALQAIRDDIGDCTRCPLAYAGRRTIVFADGDPNARLMFVGEGPGADEDASGLPFVGKSGQLLTNMIAAMGLGREDVYIANVVKCRPPANRAPEPVEANTCTQFLLRQMDVVRPEVVVALGLTAASYLLGARQSLTSLRGVWHPLRGAKARVTFHPAFLLRDPRQKVEAWKDLQAVMGELGLQPPKRG